MEWAGYLASGIIGLVLGVVGGGGSLLTIPVLMYCFGVSPSAAPTYSLFIVCAVSATACIRNIRQRQIHWRAVFLFGLPSLIMVFFIRCWLVPLLPSRIRMPFVGSLPIDAVYLLIFCLLMLASAAAMLRRNRYPDITGNDEEVKQPSQARLTGMALLTGTITGISGMGGGFLVVPALVLGAGLRLRQAIGTSLAIVCLNAGTGFLLNHGDRELDMTLTIILTAIAIPGILLGLRVSEYLPVPVLKKGFAFLLLLLAIIMLVVQGKQWLA